MKPLNLKERKKSIKQFAVVFGVMVAVMFVAGILTLTTGERGVEALELKHSRYSEMFRKKAALTYQLKEIVKRLHQINNKERSLSQHKRFQDLVSSACDEIRRSVEEESDENKEDFAVYMEMISLIKDIQADLDVNKVDSEKYNYLENMIERCKEKYLEELNKG